MADNYNPAFDLMAPGGGAGFGDDNDTPVTMGDRGKAVLSGALDVGAQAASGARAVSDATNSPNAAALADFFREALKQGGEATEESMSDSARKQLHSTITSQDFWDHPVSASVLKALNMTPGVAAAVAPAMLTDGALAPWLVAGMGGAQGAAASTDDVYSQTDAMSDAELQKAMPYYAQLRSQGVPEDQARADANTKLMGLKPLLNAAAGAAGMALGPAGRLSGLIPEDVASGLLKRMGVGAAEGALGGAMMGGAGEATHEQTQVDLDQRTQLDPAQILAATVDSAGTMGLMGAVGGAFTGGHGTAVSESEKAPVATVDAKGPDAAQAAALSANAPTPDMVTPPGNPITESQKAEPGAKSPVPTPAPTEAPTDAAANPGDNRPAGPVPGVLTSKNPKGWEFNTAATPPSVLDAAEAALRASAPDAGKTVPESMDTFRAQADQLANGQRQAMLFPRVPGGKEPMAAKRAKLDLVPEGMKTVVTKDGVIAYNPDVLKYKDVLAASKEGRLNDILALGEFSKKDLEPKIAAGEQPVAVTERQPNGTEVKAAAGTESTVPSQVASLEATKTPGNTVQVEPVGRVLTDRVAAAQAAAEKLRQKVIAPTDKIRVAPPAREVAKVEPIKPAPPKELASEKMAEIEKRLASIRQVAESHEKTGYPIQGGVEALVARKRQEMIDQAKVEAGIAEKPAAAPRARAQEKGEGKHFTKDQKAERAANNAKADEIVKRFEASAEERANNANSVGRELLLDRVRNMVETAEKEGVRIPSKLKDSTNKEMEHNNSVALLTEAKALARRNGDASTEDLTRFITREFVLRNDKEEGRRAVLAERRAEGDQKNTRPRAKALDKIVGPDPEVSTEARELEAVADDAPSPDDAYDRAREEEAPPVPERERPAVTLKGNEVTAGKDKTGTFKTETVKKRRAVKLRIGADGEREPWQEGHVLPTSEELESRFHGKVKPIESGTLGDYLKGGEQTLADSLHGVFGRYVGRRLANAVGNVKVHIVGEDEMRSVMGGDLNPSGLYFSGPEHGPTILINEHAMLDPQEFRHNLLHEGMHAAAEEAIDSSARDKQLIRQMMDMFADKIDDKVGPESDTYGLTDEHEFMSEVMGNEHFREVLSQIPAPPEMVREFKLGQNRKLSLMDMVIHFVRRALGLGDNAKDFRLIEAAVRMGDRLITRGEDFAQKTGRVRANFKPTRPGDFERAETDINRMFHEPFSAAIERTKAGGAEYVRRLTQPGKMVSDAIESAKGSGGALRKAVLAVTTNDQYRQQISKLLPMAKDIFDNNERVGVLANKLKEDGLDLTGALIRAQKQNPGLFQKFAELVNEQTMVGADASQALGEGRNAHLGLAKKLQDRLDKGEELSDIEHETAMNSWEARNAHPDLQKRYQAIVKADPEYAPLQNKLFDYFEQTQNDIARGQIESILHSYEFTGTPEERRAAAAKLASGKMTDDERADIASKLGVKDPEQALERIEAVDALKVRKGPYAPQMRRGEHAVVGEYKVDEPTNGRKVSDNTWEFKSRKEAHDFAVKTGLHTDTKALWYDTATGLRVAKKEDAISTVGQPEQRFQVRVQRQHLEFHESRKDATARLKELQGSGLLDKVGLEERRHIESENNDFTARGVEALLRSLAAQKHYQDASEHQRGIMRATVREAGLRAMSDNRVQARRLPRRYVEGASDDLARNLYDYNNSQANFRARLQYNDAIDDGLKAMWQHVKSMRYTPDNEQRSIAANEVERRMRQPDPNEYSGAYTEWTRRLSTWSYIDRMMRPSHLILHQTHLPMITAPYMSGRHGVMSAYGATMRAWKELTGFYKAGGHDAWATLWGSALQKGVDYTELGKQAFEGAADGKRLGQMLNALNEIGVIHPSSGIEAQKYMPSRQLAGPVGVLDRGLNKADTVFRHLTNATEAINRIAGATAAYRLEYAKLTRAGKSAADAHEAAVEYARQTLTDTQGLYSATNAAPIFKNKFLKPFLQFKQFPQMMYHLLSKLAVQSFKGETRQAKVQAMASLAAILGMHSMMAGVLQGLPLEPFKLLGLISKGIGLTDGDWSDVEEAERRSIKASLGNDVGNVVIHGLGSELFGVDVHHRLGLNSFVTYGMPDQIDSKSVSEFVMNSVLGAPGSLVTDALKGTHKMLNGDIEGGALQAAPLQALRDVHNAVAPAANKYGYQPTGADSVKALLGFSPAAKAQAAERKEAVYNATHEYDQQRNALTKKWLEGDREAAWQEIERWNAGRPQDEKLTKGDLFKALHRANRIGVGYNATIDGVKTTPHNKSIAQATVDLYQ